MNRNDFLRILVNYGPSDRQMTGEVAELIGIFPYFQSAYILLLKGLSITSDVKFESQLKKSALYIANREVLYYYLREFPPVKQEPTVEHEKADKISENTTDINGGIDNQQTVIESARNSEDLISEIEKVTEWVTGRSSGGDDTIVHRTILIPTESEIDESGVSVLQFDEESSQPEENIIYMDPGFSLPEPSDLLELDLIDAEQIDRKEEEPVPDDQPVKASARQLQSDLIDKFIIANPRIEPVRERPERSDKLLLDKSEPFVETADGFLSETLARIFINQCYYSKAIDIYEKLSLKFPEKSAYFASLIEKVKEIIKK